MNTRLENKLSMYYTLRTFFTKNLSALSPSQPALAGQVGLFDQLLDQLQNTVMLADENRTGAAEDKDAQRNTLHTLALKINTALYAIARLADNAPLMMQTKVSGTSLARKRNLDMLYWCEELAETAAQHSAALLPVGVDAAMLANYQAAIVAYRNALQIMAELKRDKTIAHQETTNLLRKTDQQLKIIDAMMLVLSSSHSKLYYQYLANRKIDNL